MWEAILFSFIGSFAQAVLFRIGLIKVRRSRGQGRTIRIRRARKQSINRYMKELFARASTIDVVSSRLGWVEGDPLMATHIRSLAEQSTLFRFHLPRDNKTAQHLRSGQTNIQVFVSEEPTSQGEWPRFTLSDRAAPGSTGLAVGFQDGEDWCITEFRSTDSAQIIAIARKYVELFEQTSVEVQ